MRAFRFGIQASAPPPGGGSGGEPGKAWAELARRVEGLGYSTLTVADHLDDQYAPTPALMAAADATTSLRIGALVYATDYHHPVGLAKEAATLDLLSGGRFELGLGAGWMTTDYEQAGIPLDRPGTRIDRLAEAIDVMKGLFADEPLSFEGEHYRITGLDGRPKPVQRPHPPILVGGGGRRVLSVAAREADIVGLNIALHAGRIDAAAGASATATATHEKLAWIREAAPERFDSLELQVRVHLALVTDDRWGVAEAVGPSLGLTPAEAAESPHALVGSVEEIVEQLEARREAFGISYLGISVDALDAMAPVVERLAGR